ncbi:hypothetical protein BC941DRAFT_420561 [Chlamydoabsidia padenii]|nr:hypothetical protein BC941DRAFT_420561 [Chlamydoabsidia padenii]
MHLTDNNQPINESLSCTIHDRKRKRRTSDGNPLQVRFCTQPNEIIDTYSPVEYDRSGLFSTDNSDGIKSDNIILTLSIGFVTPLSCQPTSTPPPVIKNKSDRKRPKLSIDTSNIHDGPLYFTSMTTNHQKKEHAQPLVHLDDDHEARITMENTEMNRRCLVAAV